MNGPLSVIDGGLGVRDPPEGTSADGTARIGRGVGEDKLSEKEPWPELNR